MVRSLLVAVDLSPASARVIGRAALLPLAKGARLRLLHVVPKLLPPKARKRAEQDARTALEVHAKTLATTLPKGTVVRTLVRVGNAAAEVAKLAQSSKAELIVMGRGSGRALRDSFLGSTAERVLRQAQRPVLVVRSPARESYQRPALAVALDEAADDAIATLLRLLPPPRPTVTLVHAYEVPFQATIYPSLSSDEAAEYRSSHQRKARQEIARLLNETLERIEVADPRDPTGRTPSWKIQLRLGSPRTVIERVVERIGADLLVLGTHGRAGAAYAFLGSVAGDVLRQVACDALVVPPSRDEH